jgi:uncharacterized protein YndB with AHSA1/START domain
MTSQRQQHVELRPERTFYQPPGPVYRAWLDPDLVQRWMAPGSQEVTRVEIEERPGGVWRTWKADGGVIVGGFDSELLLGALAAAMPQIVENVGPGWDAVLTKLEHALTADATAR